MEVFSMKSRNAGKVTDEIATRYQTSKKPATNNNIESVYAFADKSRIDVYKSGSIVFTGRHADFCEFREMDMRWDDELVEELDPGSPPK